MLMLVIVLMILGAELVGHKIMSKIKIMSMSAAASPLTFRTSPLLLRSSSAH